MPLLDRPRSVSGTTLGTASAGQAVRLTDANAACARPEQWHGRTTIKCYCTRARPVPQHPPELQQSGGNAKIIIDACASFP